MQYIADNPGPIVAAFAALLAAGIALYIHRHNKFGAASAAFRAAFADALHRLEYDLAADPYNILEHSFASHSAAVKEFTKFLSNRQCKRFLDAWETYHCNEQDHTMHNLAQYSRARWNNPEDQFVARKKPVKRLERLLSFAKP